MLALGNARWLDRMRAEYIVVYNGNEISLTELMSAFITVLLSS